MEVREGNGNLERQWLSGELGDSQEPTSSSALSCGPAWNPGVLVPSTLPVLLGIGKSALDIKQLMSPPLPAERKKGPQENRSLTPFAGAHPSESSFQTHQASKWKMAP